MPERAERLAWKRWLLALVVITASATALLFAFVVVLDPYSTGKLTPIKRIDFVTGNRLYDSTARVRDLRFDSAIIGNSHAVSISPAALDPATGRRFAVLAIQGTWPYEHTFLMRTFARARPAPAFVVVLDDTWCSPVLGQGYIVPRWLHGQSNFEYLSQILSPFSVRMAWRRLLILAGHTAGQPPNGYDPRPWMPLGRERMRQHMETMLPPTDGPDAGTPFPYLDDLQRTIAGLSPQTTVLLVFTPVYAKYMPVPGSKADMRLRTCKDRAAAMVRDRPRSGMLDLRIEGPKYADIDNFTDVSHFKDTITRDIEIAIAQRLNELMRASAR